MKCIFVPFLDGIYLTIRLAVSVTILKTFQTNSSLQIPIVHITNGRFQTLFCYHEKFKICMQFCRIFYRKIMFSVSYNSLEFDKKNSRRLSNVNMKYSSGAFIDFFSHKVKIDSTSVGLKLFCFSDGRHSELQVLNLKFVYNFEFTTSFFHIYCKLSLIQPFLQSWYHFYTNP